MACKLTITQKAETDLDGIVNYIVNELKNTGAAIRLVDEIEARYKMSAENPCMYGECRQPLLKATRYREIVVGGYIMVYRYDGEKDEAIIERFFSDLENHVEKL